MNLKPGKNQRRKQLKRDMLNWLSVQPGQMLRKDEFVKKVGDFNDSNSVLGGDDFLIFNLDGEKWVKVKTDFHKNGEIKKRLEEINDPKTAPKNPDKAFLQKSMEDDWKALTYICGDVVRTGSSKAKNNRLYVIARTYTEGSAAKRLSLPLEVIREAVQDRDMPSFVDPVNRIRIPAEALEAVIKDHESLEKIHNHVQIKVRDISLVLGISYSAVRSRLKKADLSPSDPRWGDIRGLWSLPDDLTTFQTMADEKLPTRLASVRVGNKDGLPIFAGTFGRGSIKKREEAYRLRQQLLDVFPTWENINRTNQHITLHLGPTNSGKTFNGLNHLVNAGSGWYLSPLRLLAHEIYDTLNKQGVLCNLLTGEESIVVEGAKITAATIEMFNPHQSGQCVIIDEVHMLSDSQRGWAWTRAIMETSAPDIHIIGSPIAETLVLRLVEELGFPINVESYDRLTPLDVAGRAWSLLTLPPKTILIAFSRKMVLGLKSELEKTHHRTVSVVYGNLPPEVRLRQAERFARGETEICVATDAVGMGLNLPADNVCFYELSKYDGNTNRLLTANEIKQIGGRAGRYGLSEHGMVGAFSKTDLKIISNALNSSIEDIPFAYVAPTPESIALLPGTLSQKLKKWVELDGIPERWRQTLKPVDLTEQIELAQLLTANDIQDIGEDAALELINAPCVKNTENYWLECACAIIDAEVMPPVAVDLPKKITNANDLETYEFAIRCADIYLWLSQRRKFCQYAPEQEHVRAKRYAWSMAVNEALIRRIDTTRRCKSCGKSLSLNYRYNICSSCYRERRFEYDFN